MVVVPMNGSCMWVCGSMPPGMTYWPPASTTVAPAGAVRFSPTATIVPSWVNTSARKARSALTTVPPRIRMLLIFAPKRIAVYAISTRARGRFRLNRLGVAHGVVGVRGPVGMFIAHNAAGAQVFFTGRQVAQRDAFGHWAD